MSTVVEEEKVPLLGTLGVVKGKKSLKEPKPVAKPRKKVKTLNVDPFSEATQARAEFWRSLESDEDLQSLEGLRTIVPGQVPDANLMEETCLRT